MDDGKIVYPKQRELDGVYTRVERNGHWCSVCFSDLTDEEQDKYMETLDETSLKLLCKVLCGELRSLADYLDAVKE